MKFSFWPIFAALIMVLGAQSALTAVDRSQLDIAVCKTVQEIEEAKARGADFLEIRGTFFVRIGGKYEGPFPSLERAVKKKRESLPADAAGEAAGGESGFYSPLSVLYPFTDLTSQNTLSFSAPGGEVVAASNVMIHGEPFMFDSVSFGPIDFKERGTVFAVTGRILSRPTIEAATGALKFQTGAAVVNGNGDVLWKQYGEMDRSLGFRCIAPVDTDPQNAPAFLLLFAVAEGGLDEYLSMVPMQESVTAKPYRFHILCSAVFDMAANWYPSIEEVIQEEYLILKKEEEERRKEQLKRGPGGK